MNKQFKFTVAELDSQIQSLVQNGVTELAVHDEALAGDKRKVLQLFNLISRKAPQLFVSVLVYADVIDKEVVSAASNIFCSFEIPLKVSSKGGKLLFDKKFYANKAKLLNDYGLVFGFDLTYAVEPQDSLKQFMDRLDFAVNQYPNHIDFPQLEIKAGEEEKNVSVIEPKVTGLFSAKDIRYARDVSFACKSFYSSGRAVPWFLSVLRPLKIYPSRFLSDFAEWQRCNNCDFKSGFSPENENHKAIEKMQLLFLDEKYEEKNCSDLITLVNDIVSINGAMSRLCGENEEATIKTSYHPDDLFSEESMDLISFVENVCMMECKVRIFAGDEGPDYQVL